MNTIVSKHFCLIALAITAYSTFGQSIVDGGVTMPLEVGYNKTSSILFPATVKSATRGSGDILAQKVHGAGNILQLKSARRRRFPETNFTVLTTDGKLYHFLVNYAENPAHLTLQVTNSNNENADRRAILTSGINEADIEKSIQSILAKEHHRFTFHRQRKYKVSVSLEGIYIDGNTMFYHLKISNRSNIDYDIDMLRFYIDDNHKLKRTSTQEITINPLYVDKKGGETIAADSALHVVYALEKFTIPEAKHLVIEMLERNGGRNLQLKIKNGTIVKAKPVPQL